MQNNLLQLLRHAYQWGRDNGSKRSEKNFNDFLQTEAVQQALSMPDIVERSEQFYCTCSRAKGLDHDEEGMPYCIECQKPVQ